MPMLRSHSFTRLVIVAAVTAAPASTAVAGPRDDLLRVAPPDAALVLILQNARAHLRNVAASPFAEWFPTSTLGKQLFGAVDLKQAQAAAGQVFLTLGVTPEELLDDIVGDAVAFAYTPPASADPKSERAVILVRPRKPETLVKLVARLNEIQTSSGEVKGVTAKQHNGAEYFERRKPAGGASDFYCFRGGVFAFSSSEADIQAVIDRDKAAKAEASELSVRLGRLGVADAFAVALINPRSFDAEVELKI